jgi:hypothetical protein
LVIISGEELLKLSLMMDAIVDASIDVGMSPIEGCEVLKLVLKKGKDSLRGET